MRKVVDVVVKAAREDLPVLIHGEPGTGKELVAKAVHNNSLRKKQKFFAVNCSAIPDDLLEKELIGENQKNQAGRSSDKIGLFKEADGGTVFLDDIADIGPDIQSRIVHMLERKTTGFYDKGATRPPGVRIIAATKQHLPTMVSQGKFRQDLYEMLSCIPITLPNLHDRGEDILLLAEHFMRKYTREFSRQPVSLTPDAARALLSYSWPGNVRELENTIKRTVALAKTDRIRREDLIMVTDATEGTHRIVFKSKQKSRMSLEEKELEFIVRSLRENNWNYTRTAKQLGIGRTTLWRKMKKIKEGENSQTVVPS
jgi:DNA-binding NtrC family response regulator